MTTITREQLELAAKAAGYVVGHELAGGLFRKSPGGSTVFYLWCPHTAPADAWQLAADCKLNIDFGNGRVFYPDGDDDAYTGIWFGESTDLTAMEAVTLAAAEIGRAMG